MEADKYLALLLDKSIKELGKEAINQVGMVYNGIERISWYLSCFTENYQNVCKKLAIEDIIFIVATGKLIPGFNINLPHISYKTRGKINNYADVEIKVDVIRHMLEVFTKNVFSEVSHERKININRILIKPGSHYSAINLTNRTLAYSVAYAIYRSAGLRFASEGALTSIAKKGTAGFGIYGYVKVAADAAERLKFLNPILYTEFYNEEVEMLYFLIEPIVRKISHSFRFNLSDEKIAADIMALTE